MSVLVFISSPSSPIFRTSACPGLVLAGLVGRSCLEQLEKELLGGSGLCEPEWAVADADGGEAAELFEDFAAGGPADPLLQESPLVGVEGLEAAAHGPLDEPVEEGARG